MLSWIYWRYACRCIWLRWWSHLQSNFTYHGFTSISKWCMFTLLGLLQQDRIFTSLHTKWKDEYPICALGRTFHLNRRPIRKFLPNFLHQIWRTSINNCFYSCIRIHRVNYNHTDLWNDLDYIRLALRNQRMEFSFPVLKS